MEEKLTIEETREVFRAALKKGRGGSVTGVKTVRRKEPKWKTVKCARCGEEISVLTRHTKYCADCRKEAKKQWQNEANRKIAEEHRSARMEKEKKKAKQKPHVSQLDAIEKAARAAGMSYGRYVAMKGAGRI